MTHRPDQSRWTRRSFLAVAAAGAMPWQRLRFQDASIDEVVRTAMKESPTPGVAIAVLQSGRLQWAKGYGFANLELQRPMTPETVLNVGSVTKTVTATAIMQLAERGLLDLDADVGRVLPFPVRNPAFPDAPITVGQLLTHTSSVGDGPDYEASYACGDPADRLADWVEKYLRPTGARYRDHPHFTTAAPGARWQYSNVGFGLLGVVIESVSKESYADYTVKHVFDPLRMTSTGWYLGRMDQARHAIPYRYVKTGAAALEMLGDSAWKPADHPTPTFVPHCLYSFPTLPDGLMRTSVADLARLVGAYQLGGAIDGTRILRAETVRAMLSPQPIGPRSGRTPVLQGLAWVQGDGAGAGVWGHGGGDPGIRTFIGFAPSGKGVAVITNSDGGRPTDIARRVLGVAT